MHSIIRAIIESRFTRLAAALPIIMALGCTGGSFSSGGKKIEESQKPKAPVTNPAEKPDSASNDQDTDNLGNSTPGETSAGTNNNIAVPDTSDSVDSTNHDVVVPSDTVDTSNSTAQPPADVTGTTDSADTTPPTVVTPPAEDVTGIAQVTATCFVNMEKGYHGTDENFIIQLVDSKGVAAAGHATIEAVRNGTPTDGSGAYPGMILAFDLSYVREAASGSGTINVCYSDPATSPENGKCEHKQGMVTDSADRPTALIGKPASWTVNNDNGKPVFKVSGNYSLSTHHPVWAFAKAGACFKDFQSPVVLDLNLNGTVDLVDVWNDKSPVRFDINGDGRKVRTGWVKPGDGLLAMDFNGNGLIDSGLELFGEYTQPVDGKPVTAGARTWENGYAALAARDLNQDGRIDAKDTIWSELLVWQDRNLDGISQKDELRSLAAAGVQSLSLAYSRNSNRDPVIVHNNEVRLVATFTTTSGRTGMTADVWFRQRRFADQGLAGK